MSATSQAVHYPQRYQLLNNQFRHPNDLRSVNPFYLAQFGCKLEFLFLLWWLLSVLCATLGQQ
jgi:hypothetical protein